MFHGKKLCIVLSNWPQNICDLLRRPPNLFIKLFKWKAKSLYCIALHSAIYIFDLFGFFASFICFAHIRSSTIVWFVQKGFHFQKTWLCDLHPYLFSSSFNILNLFQDYLFLFYRRQLLSYSQSALKITWITWMQSWVMVPAATTRSFGDNQFHAAHLDLIGLILEILIHPPKKDPDFKPT